MHVRKNSEPIRLMHGFTQVKTALKAQINGNQNIGGGGFQMPPPATKLCHPSGKKPNGGPAKAVYL